MPALVYDPELQWTAAPDFTMTRSSTNALKCRVGTRQVWVRVLAIRYGTEIGKVGDCGNLVISRTLAQQVGLLARTATPSAHR